MGDRCSLKMQFRASDEAKVRAAIDIPATLDLDVSSDGLLGFEIEEANWAYQSERESMAQAGVIFEGVHGAGSSYSGARFCAIDGVMYEVPEVNGDIAVGFNMENGLLIPDTVTAARDYREAMIRIKTVIENVPPVPKPETAESFVNRVARLDKDGEIRVDSLGEREDWEMSIDDAFDTLHSLIDMARRITGYAPDVEAGCDKTE